VKLGGTNTVSLIARHVSAETGEIRSELTSEHTLRLIQIAIELHDRALRRDKEWHIWLPLIGVVVGSAFTICGIWLNTKF
jgi:hypothetical protein